MSTEETLQIHIDGSANLPTLIYLPGMHGDWTLVSAFGAAVSGKVRFVKMIYPRTLDWTLEDYANAVEEALLANGIESGWLLAESFGSQVAWPLCDPHRRGGGRRFHPKGVILAGGFVRHPLYYGVRLLRWWVAGLTQARMQRFLKLYAWYVKRRHPHSPQLDERIDAFVQRRTDADLKAIAHRLDLIAANDPASIVSGIDIPVYYLAGLVDPLVPWPWVRSWLRRRCPQYQTGTTFLRADHAVLCSAPEQSAGRILEWMRLHV
jgi:pimeloyl-ACP methyl ester carboxylesterase